MNSSIGNNIAHEMFSLQSTLDNEATNIPRVNCYLCSSQLSQCFGSLAAVRSRPKWLPSSHVSFSSFSTYCVQYQRNHQNVAYYNVCKNLQIVLH